MVVGRKFNDEAFESKDAGTAEPWIGSEYFSLAKGNLLFCVTLLLLLLVVYEEPSFRFQVGKRCEYRLTIPG